MIRMALHLFGYDLRAFLRNRQSQFFTLALPVLFLVIFASVFGGSGNTTQVAGGQISTSVYYVPGIIALGVIAACFGNLAASVTAQRERGVLKRRRATPVPAAAVIAGRVLTAVAIAVVMAAVLLGIGWATYGAHVPGRAALALAVTVVIGAASFCCLGYALTSLIRNEDAALPTTSPARPYLSRAPRNPASARPLPPAFPARPTRQISITPCHPDRDRDRAAVPPHRAAPTAGLRDRAPTGRAHCDLRTGRRPEPGQPAAVRRLDPAERARRPPARHRRAGRHGCPKLSCLSRHVPGFLHRLP
jgi:ABC-2 type transport system permease protein